MKEIRKIKDIVFFSIIDNDIFYANKDSLYLNYELFLSPIEDRLMELSGYEDNYSLVFTSGNGYILYKNKEFIKFPYWCYSSIIYNNLIAVYEYDYDLLSSMNNIYDIKHNSLIFSEWQKGNCYILNHNKYVYVYVYQKDISFFDLKKADSMHFSIKDFPPYSDGFGREQEADIKQIIGIYNNLLWIHIGGFRLIAINIDTGEMIHHTEDMRVLLGLDKDDFSYFDLSPFSKYAIHLDEAQGLLKAFAHRYYIEIDLNNFSGVVKKDFGADWESTWRIKNSNFYPKMPDLLLFSGFYKDMKKSNAFGIFDTKKAEILWFDVAGESECFNNPPQANDELLAILDDKQNLLIYNKHSSLKTCLIL